MDGLVSSKEHDSAQLRVSEPLLGSTLRRLAYSKPAFETVLPDDIEHNGVAKGPGSENVVLGKNSPSSKGTVIYSLL